jgi:two-component system, NtrC family, response regulator AtoC
MTSKILIVEDDRDMSAELARLFSRRGFEVVLAYDVVAALELVSSTDFDTVVTDITMRGKSGLELCQRLVENYPELPVIVVTAFGSLERAIATLRAGAFDFLTKPFVPASAFSHTRCAAPCAARRSAQAQEPNRCSKK